MEVLARDWGPAIAVGSESDFRKGESRERLPLGALTADGLNPVPSSISSNMDCVEVEGIKSSLAVETAGASSTAILRDISTTILLDGGTY
jgi:hypothetical protein